jgi:hypothetical protein
MTNYSPFRLPARLPDEAGFFFDLAASKRIFENSFAFIAARSVSINETPFQPIWPLRNLIMGRCF